MSAFSDEIEHELAEVEREAEYLTAFLARLERDGFRPGSLEGWTAIGACGSAAEKIYTGAGRIMRLLSEHVDGRRVHKSPSWHADLLRFMATPVEGGRGPIISDGVFASLNDLRAFRHRERHSYAHGLDPSTVMERAGEAIRTFECFRHEVRAFLANRPP